MTDNSELPPQLIGERLHLLNVTETGVVLGASQFACGKIAGIEAALKNMGMVEVSEEVYNQVHGSEGYWTFTNGVLSKDEKPDSVLAADVRRTRDGLLNKCDWCVQADSPLSADMRSKWIAYRQALRDLTDQSGFPRTITWPTPPKEDSSQ